MPQRQEGLRPVFRLLGSLGVVLIPFALFSYFYFEQRYDYHVDRNFRVLTEAGEHLSALLRQFESLFDFDPYNEIEKTGYPIRAIVEKRFADKKAYPKTDVEKFMEALEKDVEPTRKKTKEQEIAEKIKAFRKALKDALDKEKKLRLLENLLREELIKAELERFTNLDKNELASALGTMFQSRAESEKNLTRELSYPPPKLVPAALKKARKEADEAWNNVEKKQQQVMCMLNGDAEDSSMMVEYVSNKKADAERCETCKKLTCNNTHFKGENEKTEYLTALKKVQEDQGEELKKKVGVFNKNPSYKNLNISPDEEDQCEQAALKESIRLQINTSKAQTSLSVTACQRYEWSGLSWNPKAELPLAALMSSTDAEAKNFDLLVLAQGDGKVLYSSSETHSAGIPQSVFAKFASLKPFFQEDKSEAETKKANPDEENEQKDKDRQVSLPLVSVIRKAEVSGTTYRLFLQPFQPPLPIVSQSAAAEPVWYLGGIIRESEFQKKFLALPLTVTGLTMIGLILGLLSWPYVKMFFTSPREPLRAIDIFFLIISLVLGSGLVTLLLLNTVAYHNMRAQFDTTAKRIGERIQKRFGVELEATLDTLSEASDIAKKRESEEEIFLELIRDKYPPCESIFLVEEHGGLEPEHWRTFESRRSTKSIDISKREYFLRAKDEEGLWQKKNFPDFFIERVHSYTNGVKTSAVSAHYKQIKQKKKKGSLDCVAPRIVAEDDFPGLKLVARTNGEKVSVVPKNGEIFAVAALAKRFLSFRALALPPSFGFAVIEDNTGKVIFHSEDQRSLIENFFWETDGNLQLQAAVHAHQVDKHAHQVDKHAHQVDKHAHQVDKITGYYHGRRHNFFVIPVDSSIPWSLVVFYDTQLLETVNFEIGVITAGIFLFYVVVFVLVLVLIHFFGPRELWSWCWPQSRSRDEYAFVAALLVLVVLSYGLGIWPLKGGWPFLLLIVLLPLFVLGTLYFKCKRKFPGPAWSKKLTERLAPKLSFRCWYLSVAFLGLGVVSVLPIAAIFKDTFLAQAERFTKFRESEFVIALENRERTLRDDMNLLDDERSEVEEGTKSENFIKNTIKPGLYEYKGDHICLHKNKKMNQSDSCKDNAGVYGKNWHLSEWFIMDFLPVYNELAGKLRYPGSKQQSRYDPNIGYQAQPSQQVFRPHGDWRHWPIYLCILIFLILLYAVIRSLARRVVGLYLSDFEVLGKDSKKTTVHKLKIVDDPEAKTEGHHKKIIIREEETKKIEEWAKEWTDTDKKRRVLVRPPRALVSKLQEHAKQSGFRIIDFSSPTQLLPSQLERWTAASSPKEVLVTHFELSFLEPRLQSALLGFLESKRNDTVILCSSISPLHRLVTPEAYPEFDKGAQEAVPKADEKLRWSALLSTFRKERFWYEASDWRKDTLQVLSRECCWADELIPIYTDLKEEAENLTEEQIIHQVGDRAEAFYRKLWMLCTREERLVLIHMAQGGLVNLQNADTVQCLLWRNLIRRDPDLCLPNESFARFILTAEAPERIAEWEKGEADGSTWTMLRAPLLLLLVLVAVFTAQTGGEGVGAMTAIVSSVLAGLPIIFQALNFLRGGQTAKPVEE